MSKYPRLTSIQCDVVSFKGKRMKIIMILVCTLMLHAQDDNRTEELNKLSFDVYAKPYERLRGVEKKHIEDKLHKIDRVYVLALKNNVTKMKAYKQTMQKAQRSIAMNTYLASVRSSIAVSKKEIKAYYDAHIKDYTYIYAYTLVRKKNDFKSLGAMKKLQESKDTLEVFKALAKQYSQHPKASKGGDLGLIGYNTMVQPFGSMAYGLKAGTYNIHLLKRHWDGI